MRVLMAPDWTQKNPYLNLLAEGLSAQGVTVVFPRGYRRGLPLWRTVRSQGPVELLHLHWQEAYAYSRWWMGELWYGLRLWLDLRLIKASGCRLVWTMHNELPHDARFPRVQRFIQRLVAQSADGVIVHTPTALPVLAAFAPEAARKAAVIPHGGYQDYYGPAAPQTEARRRLGLPQEGCLFLFFGLLYPYKGIDVLLEAWRRVAHSAENLYLAIVGEPESPEYGRRIEALSRELPHVVARFEYVPDEEVRYYFSAADCAVFPFRRILTSGSLTLAKSYSVPVVVPDCPATRAEVAEPDGFFFERGDAESLGAALRRAALARQTRRRPASPGLSSWEDIARATLNVYRAALGDGPRRAEVDAALSLYEGSNKRTH